MEFYKAIELAVFIGHEGQIEMNSKLEMRLLSRLVEYIKESNLSRLEQALAFIYLKCWGPNAKEGFDQSGDGSSYQKFIKKLLKHVLVANCLEFSNEDFHGALIMILYPMESQMKENMKQLKTLILDQFSSDTDKFNSWSRTIYKEVKFFFRQKTLK